MPVPHANSVVVVGSVNVDTMLLVETLPSPGETIAGRSGGTGIGGKGANQSIAARAAGADVRLLAAVGSDPGGDLVADGLDAHGVDVTDLLRAEGPSGTATVVVDDAAENLIVITPGANALLDPDTVASRLAVDAGDVVLLQGEVRPAVNARAARAARAAGATVIWNAAPAPTVDAQIVRDAHLVIVNEGELAALSALLATPARDVLDARLRDLADALHADVVCTLGADGALALIGGEIVRVAAPRVDAVDTTAAGDTFVGYLAAHWADPIDVRLRRAALAGAITVTRPGAAASIPSASEVDDFDSPTLEGRER